MTRTATQRANGLHTVAGLGTTNWDNALADLNALPLIITANTTLYVTTAGNDSTGTGLVGAPFATISGALAYLAAFSILPTAVVTINVANGTYSDTPVIAHPNGSQIEIVGNAGAALTSISATSITADGSSAVVLGFASVASFTSAGGDCVVFNQGTGTNHEYLLSAWIVNSVDSGAKTITLNTAGLDVATTGYPGAGTLSGKVLKTHLGQVSIATGCCLRRMYGVALDGLVLYPGAKIGFDVHQPTPATSYVAVPASGSVGVRIGAGATYTVGLLAVSKCNEGIELDVGATLFAGTLLVAQCTADTGIWSGGTIGVYTFLNLACCLYGHEAFGGCASLTGFGALVSFVANASGCGSSFYLPDPTCRINLPGLTLSNNQVDPVLDTVLSGNSYIATTYSPLYPSL